MERNVCYTMHKLPLKRHVAGIGFILLILCGAPLYAQESIDYIHYKLGVKYKTEGNYDLAVEEFRKIMAEYPDNYNAYMHVAEIRLLQGKPQLAIANLKQALVYNPGWNKARKLLAETYRKDGQIQKAILEYQQYQQSCDPAERDSLQMVINQMVAQIGGRAALNATDTSVKADTAALKKALEALPEPAIKNPKADELFNLVKKLYNEKKHDEALAAIKELLLIEKGFDGAYYYGGLLRLEKGQAGLARINFERAQAWPENGYDALYQLGLVNGTLKRYAEAIKYLNLYSKKSDSKNDRKKAIDLIKRYRSEAGSLEGDSAPPSAHGSKDSTVSVEEPPILEVRIDSLLTMVADDTLSDVGQKLLKGIREFQKGNFDKAVDEFKKTLVAHPVGKATMQCRFNIGVCYYKLRLLKESENQFQQVIERYPGNELAARSLFLIALSYAERKDPKTSESLFRTFLQKHRGHAWEAKAWEHLGDAYGELDQDKKAVDAYIQSVNQSTTSGDKMGQLFKLGSTYLQVGNSARAITMFDSIIAVGEKSSLSTRVPDAYYRIADQKYKDKKYQEAERYYAMVSRKYPAFQETPWGLFQLGNIHRSQGRYQKAIDTYKDLIQRFGDDYWAKQAKWKLDDTIWEFEYRSALQ